MNVENKKLHHPLLLAFWASSVKMSSQKQLLWQSREEMEIRLCFEYYMWLSHLYSSIFKNTYDLESAINAKGGTKGQNESLG